MVQIALIISYPYFFLSILLQVYELHFHIVKYSVKHTN
jgi:hypothetical protein